ncbi:MAG: thioredoxin family protein [Sulfuricurvum sp.]|jgi:thioredoxin-related protein
MLRSLALVLLFSSVTFASQWLNDYYEALEVAKKENKDIYMFVGADDCRWCDYFKEITLSKPEVIKRLEEDFVLLYLSRDRHTVPYDLEVQGVPRHYFFTNRGKLYYQDRGSREIDGFYLMLDEAELSK